MIRTPADPCFFILGYGRSGTTLFRRMLSAHPGLFVVPENDAFQRLPSVIGRGVCDTEALSKVIAAFPPYYARIYDVERFRSEATARLPMTPPELFVTLIGTARIAEGKANPVWGHKMPSEWPYIGTWRRWFPSARFLHMVRHPHDATASMVEYQLQRYPTTPLVGIWQWRRAFRTIRRHGHALGPERYLMLHYEDLVARPEETLGAACRFLGVSEDAVPAMINYRSDPSAAHGDEGVHMARTETALTSGRIGRASSDYSEAQKAMLDHVCRRELAELGYAPRAARTAGPLRQAAFGAACSCLDVAWEGLRALRRVRGQL